MPPTLDDLPGYADAVRHATAAQAVLAEGFATGQAPSVVEGGDMATLDWLAAERVYNEDAG